MIAVTTELHAKEGHEARLEQQMQRLAEKTRDEEAGCRLFVFARSVHDPQLFVTLERYDDEEALSAHSHADHYTEALPDLMECLTEPPRVALFEEV